LRLTFGLMLIVVATRFILSSDDPATFAAVGLLSLAVAGLAYVGLRLLGRRHLPPPDLGDKIRRAAEQAPPSESEYYI
jgi:hypothetical protein